MSAAPPASALLRRPDPRRLATCAGGLALIAAYATAMARPEAGGAAFPAILAVFAAAAVSSIAGFAFSAVCGAMLFHLLPDPVAVVQTMMLCSIANQSLALWSVRGSIDAAALRPFAAAGAFGAPAGVFLLLHADPHAYLRALGCVLVLWSMWRLLRRPVRVARPTQAGDMAFGFAAGVLAGFCGFAGALIAVRGSMRGWDKSRQRGVCQPAIILAQVAALACIALMRPAGAAPAFALDGLVYVPGSLLGTYVGLGVFRRLSDKQFTWALHLTLIASGAALAA